jgi:hypothetical protein
MVMTGDSGDCEFGAVKTILILIFDHLSPAGFIRS